jgi:hypothetical protein
MKVNTIEQVIAEWYDLKGYFIRRNIIRPSPHRGQSDLDLVAFHPNTKHMIHIEGSTEVPRGGWTAVKTKMEKKFALDRTYLETLYPNLPVEQLFVYYKQVPDEQLYGGIKVLAFPDLLIEIRTYLETHRLEEKKIPEGFPLLRVLHHAAQFWSVSSAPPAGRRNLRRSPRSLWPGSSFSGSPVE